MQIENRIPIQTPEERKRPQRENGAGSVEKDVAVKPLNIQTAEFRIRGTAQYCQNRFSAKAMQAMKAKQEAGSTAKGKRAREAKDFEACYNEALHVSEEGWYGIPASAFRNGLISACRLVNFKMTLAKLSVFTKADGYDRVDSTPLVKITKGKPHRVDSFVRNDTGVADIRPRPVWEPGWEALVRVSFDADQFTLNDVTNLMVRVGAQVGVGEGRPDSKSSAGIGWGTFELVEE